MPEQFSLKALDSGDRVDVMRIFNHYVENSFAAFPEKRLDESFFDRLIGAGMGLPAFTLRDSKDKVIGYGMLRPYNPMPAFRKTAEVSYFIDPEYTGQGIGGMLLSKLESEAHALGIGTLLAEISSKNPNSIRFHEKNGFRRCGCMEKAGVKHGETFDLVWMQKFL